MEKTKSQALTKEDRELIETNMTGAKICMEWKPVKRLVNFTLQVVENRLGEERANDEKSPIKLV